MNRSLTLALIALLALPGCFGYAPPVRAGFDGMPERIRAGSGSVASQYGVASGTFTGDARVGVGVVDGLRVTIGGTAAQGFMGNVGIRANLVDAGIVSLELGADLGLGVGGHESNIPEDADGATEENDSQDNDELVVGGAFDLTLGIQLHRYGGIYIPVRVQVSDAPSNPLIPITLFHQLAIGWQADWTDSLFTRLDVGYAGLTTLESTGEDDPDTTVGWTANFGFGARWGGPAEL